MKLTLQRFLLGCAVVLIALSFCSTPARSGTYNPLDVTGKANPKTVELTVNDNKRQRQIPLRVYLPEERSGAPVVIFSHGLGGSCKNNAYLGTHWANRGYAAVFVQHPGSDVSVWKNVPPGKRVEALKKAANKQNFMLRVKDIPRTLDQLRKWNTNKKHPLHNRLDMKRIGMSGHSFGALTTQAVSGQTFAWGKPFADPRIDAALVLSPSCPSRWNPEKAFGNVDRPWIVMTGTKDTSPIGSTTLDTRLAVYPALPAGDKYELVLHRAEHSAFTERPLPGDTEERNPNHHRAILALSTAFWDTYLRENKDAGAWLNGRGPREVLEKKDRWRTK